VAPVGVAPVGAVRAVPAYAGFVSRTAAFVVDAVVVTAATTGVVGLAAAVALVVGARARAVVAAVMPTFVLTLPVLLALYGAAFCALAGRTPGMALLGLRVRTTAGRPVGWTAALARAVVLAYLPLAALWCLFDRRGQGLHDKVAGTTVVRGLSPPGRAGTRPARRVPSG
jgi:uncharacterized RDD family membrane protein YckC